MPINFQGSFIHRKALLFSKTFPSKTRKQSPTLGTLKAILSRNQHNEFLCHQSTTIKIYLHIFFERFVYEN